MKSSKPNKSKQTDTPPTSFLSGRTWLVWIIVIAGIVTLATLKDRMNQPSPTESSPVVASTNAPPSAATANRDFQKLTGKWLRPDGGYVIEIKSADASGKLDAGYFNPKPIHVAKAEAKQEGSATKVFIELQDVNYPGSTYTLTYVPERDLLVGNYYQALQGQNFEVYFERLK